jgi:hypothetical protein
MKAAAKAHRKHLKEHVRVYRQSLGSDRRMVELPVVVRKRREPSMERMLRALPSLVATLRDLEPVERDRVIEASRIILGVLP